METRERVLNFNEKDYVYNPKEARLRKAMREQTRELSRRSILQSAIANANARTIGGGASAISGEFLNQHHRFDCASVPMGPNVSPHQESWYQAANRGLKPTHSPRIGDWYGNVCGDPIERLQAMGAMHQQQRDLDKPIKDQRNQAFASNGYSPDIAAAEREIRRQESAAEYADFVDGQKWHPYQNSVSPHPHPRTPHPSPQMGGILHPNVQNTNAHGHTHGPWGQFCPGVLPHVPLVAHNATIRGPRHAVFLRDRTPTRHCAFSEDASQMSYAPRKLNIDNIRASYPLLEHQMPRLLDSSVDSVIDSTTTMNRREEDDGTRWEANSGVSLDELVPTSTPQEGTVSREKEQRESRHSSERFEAKRRPVSKQPLPGFHQAFGSTEIGRFSRSEFFVNMVGETGTGGGSGGGGDAGDDGGDDGDLIPEAYLTTPLLFPFPSTSNKILGTNAFHGITENGQLVSRILPNECCWFAQSGHAINKIPDNLVTYAALLDYSNDSDERKWMRQKVTIAHPMDFPILLGNQSMDRERIISNHAPRNCVTASEDKIRDRDIRREQGSEAVNLKIDRDQNSLVSLHESEKKN
ncbi:hypothetical protein EAG_09630 [Camponotus floridanus]|uniref:Uncharacterized protein n=1 Tax=Camponotus floridanus TaxID=104421 RepID=E2AS74_CAMFO|nr:hypothetical protein EAG_09630 [Camponotus floridanus]